MKKSEWINAWANNERFVGVNRKVIEFIANILYHSGDDNPVGNEGVYQLFAAGYCYYFASMLKMAFNRGTVCWHKGFGHIVWLDEDNIAYDIGGVFYDYGEGDLVDVSELGSDLKNFLHIPE